MTPHAMPRLTQGARALEQMRLGGKRPFGSIVVTDNAMVANMLSGTGLHVLRVGTGAYEMRSVRGLPVIAALVGTDVLGVLASVEEAKPAQLLVFLGEDVLELLDLVLDLWRKAPKNPEVAHG